MEKDILFVSNWKMNLNCDEELDFASSNYDKFIELAEKNKNTIILCPSFLNLYPLIKIFKETKIKIGAQDCSKHSKGSFTSQICAESLSLLGCKYCIIGHSESIKENKYTTDDILQKFSQLINYKISPIVCIGESIKEYENGTTIDIIIKKLEKFFNIINSNIIIPEYLPVCLAYEPLWAIGTGKTPTQDQLETTFAYIFEKTQKFCPQVKWKLLYGGSVNSKNIKKMKEIKNINGFLIGSASLNFQEFEKIVEL